MILPRPLINDAAKIINHIKANFTHKEEFHICTNSAIVYKYDRLDEQRLIIHCYIGNTHHKIGLMHFYCNVTKDIGLAEPIKLGGYTAIQWLLSGINGEKNITRLARAMAMNKSILPYDNEAGHLLKAILMEANDAIGEPLSQENKEVVELLDYELIKFGTYLDLLIKEAGL